MMNNNAALANINAMRDIDIQTVDRAALIDLRDVPIDGKLPQRERLAEFIKRIGNPYCYKCGGIVVKESFSDNGKTIEDCLEQYMGSLI
jgi:hypothetical protein